MRKRLSLAILIVSLSVIITSLFTGCSKKIDDKDAYDSMIKAISNSIEQQEIIISKEKIYENKNCYFTKINTIGDVKDYKLVVDSEGKYVNRKLEFTQNVAIYDETTKRTFSYDQQYVLLGPSANKDGENIKNLAFVTSKTLEQAKAKTSTKEIIATSFEDYYYSEDFRKYLPESKLKMIELLQYEDLDFGIDGATAESNLKVKKVSFKVKDSYFERLGISREDSPLGCDRVEIEMSFDRISYIYCYVTEYLGGSLTSEKETYKYEISYFGRKLEIPNYDSKNWINIEIRDIY